MIGYVTLGTNDIAKAAPFYDELLGLKGTRYATLCACAVGYRSEDDKYATAPKVRYPLDQVIEHR